ncbi:MAG: hypothetical protein KIT84_27190 [Labilithrix sp.]|nr:hypothetical protein [Labilithrix sp.]MCW5814742.1 hypothetical protein [Labilithrix sp.]
MPTHFWCWSESDAAIIESWNQTLGGSHRVLVGGSPLLQRTEERCSEARDEIDALLRASGKKRYGLVTLQPGAANAPPDWVLQALREAPSDILWGIRIHPMMWSEEDAVRARFDRLGAGRFDVTLSSRLPLVCLLARTTVHVTGFSSTVLEASSFGVTSVTFHPEAPSFYPDVEAAGRMNFVTSRDEMVRALEAVSVAPTARATSHFGDRLGELLGSSPVS